jgi:hypothetical protein
MATAQPLPAEPLAGRLTDEETEVRADGLTAGGRTGPGPAACGPGDDGYAGDAVLEDRDVERILIAI